MPPQFANLIELRARPEARYIWQGHTVLVTAHDGIVHGQEIEGLYYHNTRLLSRWQHLINAKGLQYVASTPVDPYSMLGYYLAPGILEQVPPFDAQESGLALQVARFVGDGMHEDTSLENYTQTTVQCELAWEVTSDFADLTEAVLGWRQQEGAVETTWQKRPDGDWELSFRYALPGLDRAVTIRFPAADPPPRWQEGCVRYTLTLQPRETRHLCVAVAPIFEGRRLHPVYGCYAFDSTSTEHDRVRERFLAEATRLQTPNAQVQAVWDRAVTDLASLPRYDGRWPEVLTPNAGVPAYMALFGRDTLTAAWQAAMVAPVLMEATIHATARDQGTKTDDFHDEQPGRIIQQVNLGPLAMQGKNPYRHYYGDYAAPSDFLTALGQYYAWTDDADTVRRFQGTAERVLDWLDGPARLGSDFLTYKTRSSQGQTNQGWKDSGVAVVGADGRGVADPIATCELQGYLYAGKQQYALALAFGLHKFSEALQRLKECERLKQRFAEAFWMPAERFLAFGLDPEKQQIRSIVSNAGQCLATGIVAGEHAVAVAERLMAPDMFSGWGIRTLSSEHPAFNPLAYQLGAVWPVEAATIAFGLRRYGFDQQAADLARGLFDLAALFTHHRLPEVVGGYQRDQRHPHPGVYPQSESPQAWSTSAVPMMLQALLALRPFAPLKLLFIDPSLPEWLPDLTLSNLRVGSARVSLRFHREADGSTGWKVIEKRGTVFVVQQPPESSVETNLWQRGAAALGSLLPWTH